MRFFSSVLAACVLWCAAWLGAAAGQCRADDQADVQKVLAQWQGLREQVGSVRYLVRCKRYIPKDLMGPGEPSADVAVDDERQYFFDFRGNRLRKEVVEDEYHGDLHKFVKARFVVLFDGQEIQQFRRREDNPHLQEVKYGEYDWDLIKSAKIPFLALVSGPPDSAVTAAHLCHFHRLAGDIEDRLQWPLDPKLYRAEGQGVFRNRQCTLIGFGQQRVRYRVWADSEGNGRVLQVQIYDVDREVRRIEIEYQPGTSVPVLSRSALYDVDGEGSLRKEYDLTVVEHELNPDLSRVAFHVEGKPGMILLDASTGKSYEIDSSGRPGKDVTELMKERAKARSGWQWWGALLGIAAVVALIAAVVYLRRRRGGA